MQITKTVSCESCRTEYNFTKSVPLLTVHVTWKNSVTLSLGKGISAAFGVRHRCCPQEKVDVKFAKRPTIVVVAMDYLIEVTKNGQATLQKSSVRMFIDRTIPVTTVDGATKKYELWGMILHQGGNQGHYYSTVQIRKGIWQIFNDSQVNTIVSNSVPHFPDPPSLLIYKDNCL